MISVILICGSYFILIINAAVFGNIINENEPLKRLIFCGMTKSKSKAKIGHKLCTCLTSPTTTETNGRYQTALVRLLNGILLSAVPGHCYFVLESDRKE